MNVRNFALSVSTLALVLVSVPGITRAQGPLYDKVMVNLPYTVTVGDHVLQPGDYVIQQLHSDGSHTLLIYSNNGDKFETSSITIPALKVQTPGETQVILHHIGPDYYFDKVWIQGKNYGYEFPLPPSVKAREKEMMQPLTVAATYQAVPQQVAEAAPPPAPAPEAQPAPAPAPAPEAQPAPAPAPAPQPMARAERMHRLPKTANNWVLLLLAGALMSASGLVLRRKAWTV